MSCNGICFGLVCSVRFGSPCLFSLFLFFVVRIEQVFDILWSDPQHNEGCQPNGLRGAGTYFGPDVTHSFLQKNKFVFLVRSHECKHDGYEMVHGGKVISKLLFFSFVLSFLLFVTNSFMQFAYFVCILVFCLRFILHFSRVASNTVVNNVMYALLCYDITL